MQAADLQDFQRAKSLIELLIVAQKTFAENLRLMKSNFQLGSIPHTQNQAKSERKAILGAQYRLILSRFELYKSSWISISWLDKNLFSGHIWSQAQNRPIFVGNVDFSPFTPNPSVCTFRPIHAIYAYFLKIDRKIDKKVILL